MRVRFTSDYAAHIEGQYRVDQFVAGQEFDGPFAGQLLRAGCPVEVIEADPEPEPEGPAVDTDGDGVPDGSIKQVLAWVGDDAARAAAALAAETAKGDAARAGLLTALGRLTA